MKYITINTVSIVFGLYMVVEATGSILLLEDDPLFNFGRFIRIAIGAFLIYLGCYRMIK